MKDWLVHGPSIAPIIPVTPEHGSLVHALSIMGVGLFFMFLVAWSIVLLTIRGLMLVVRDARKRLAGDSHGIQAP